MLSFRKCYLLLSPEFYLGARYPCKLQTDKSDLFILHLYLEAYQVSQNRLLSSVPKPNCPTPLISQLMATLFFQLFKSKTYLFSPLLSSYTPHLISENPLGSSSRIHLDSNNFSPYLPPLRPNYLIVHFLQLHLNCIPASTFTHHMINFPAQGLWDLALHYSPNLMFLLSSATVLQTSWLLYCLLICQIFSFNTAWLTGSSLFSQVFSWLVNIFRLLKAPLSWRGPC